MGDTLVDDLIAATAPGVALGDLAERLQWAGDASIYRLVPRAVVLVRHAGDVRAVMLVAARHRVAVCFRAGGTSLSGQAVSDGILIVVSRHLRAIRVHPGAALVSCQPGAVGAWVNAALAPHGRRIGPDPASLQAAEIGGIVANNASGMCCGVAENSYRTIAGLDLILADGWRIDTAAADADARLAAERPQLAAGLQHLAAQVRGDRALAERIARAFATKNTVGYSLNAFLDADTPVRILEKLVVGSEGTLAFIAEATFRTLPLALHRSTAWLLFADAAAACRAVAPLAAAGAAAIEILDAVALRRVAARLPDALPAGAPAALLVEFQEADATALAARIAAAGPVLLDCVLAAPAQFTQDPVRQAALWTIRKGLFPSVGAVRAAGTAVVIEDVTFPVAALAEGLLALRACCDAHGYGEAVIFGHAKDGNLHFTLTPDLSLPDEVARYSRFMAALVDLVLGRGGALKAEHGTGRNMAPFVARQWGEDAVAVMRRIKVLLDPAGMLNPGVLLSDDPEAHLRHLKTMPAVDPLVDRCIECGFCEPICPSRDLTLSPRQRIAALRETARGGPGAAAVLATWQYQVLDTCAADGTCATACPVGIDTGALVRAGRAAAHGAFARLVAGQVEQHLELVAMGTRGLLRLGRLTGAARWLESPPLPAAAQPLPESWPQAETGAPTIVYLPSCLARTCGDDAVPTDLARLCAAAGIGMIVPQDAAGLCCGQAFASKGFPAAAHTAVTRVFTAIAATATIGQIVVSDASTCAGHLAEELRTAGADEEVAGAAARRTLLHPAAFAAEVLIPRLLARGRLARDAAALLLHPTCTETRLGWEPALRVAGAGCTSGPVLVPDGTACCGAAGDKAWTMPELTAAATRREVAGIHDSGATLGIATSAPCAAALAATSGVAYRHLFSVLAARLTTGT